MRLHFYAMSFADDFDVVCDMLDSAAKFADHIYISDGGFSHALCHHPRYTRPLWELFLNRPESNYGIPESALSTATDEHHASWNGVPLTLWGIEYQDPAHARNNILTRMAQETEQPDWIVAYDSDEVASDQFINGIRPFLENIPADTQGVYVKRLNLVQDEQHAVDSSQSNWLAHPTIHRPNSAYFEGNYHENMVIDRSKCVRWDIWGVIHTRALYRRRLWVQRGHSSIASGDTPFWKYVKMEDAPKDVTWTLHWPKDEVEIPFDVDIRDFQGGKYAVIPQSE